MRKKLGVLSLVVLGVLTWVTWGYSSSFLPFLNSSTGVSDSALPRAERTLAIIQRHYYDQGRVDPEEMLKSGMKTIAERVHDFFVVFSDSDHVMRMEVGAHSKSYSYAELSDLSALLPFFREAFLWLEEEGSLKREHLESADLEYAVCQGFLDTLDPHSSVLSPDIFKEFQTQTEGEFGGVGIVIGLRDALLTVIAPLAGTPASRAGIESGDRIVKIDTEPSLNMPLSEAVEKLRGKVGTAVKVTIEREGRGEFAVTLTREIIQIESIQSTLVSESGKAIGYIRIKSFQEDTFSELVKHLTLLKKQAPGNALSGLILDMRNNPGGLLAQAVEVSDLFLSEGPIVMTVGTGAVVEDIRMAHAPGTESNYPMVVLVNQGSASAAEIVAAALRDNKRATLIGEDTFGKGSVQSVFSLDRDSALKMTIAEYWTAARKSIQSVGIVPDIELFPMKVSAKWMDLMPNEKLGESDLDRHLENTHAAVQSAKHHLSYFDEKFFKDSHADDAEDEQKILSSEEAEKEYGREAHVEGDYWVEVAKRVINGSFSTALKEMERVEGEKLLTALQKLKIDWTPPSGKGAPSTAHASLPLELKTVFKQGGKIVPVLRAGEEGTIEVSATNLGKAPLSQILVVGHSLKRHFIFDDREFAFGRIDSGQTKVASTTFKLPPTLPDFSEPITYEIYSAFREKLGEAKALYTVARASEPQFSFSYSLADRGVGLPTAGNGMVDPGERVELKLRIKNEGSVPAVETQVNLKNLSGKDLTLDVGRQELGPLNPGQEKTTTLSFVVSREVEKKDLSVDLFIGGQKTESLFHSRFAFALSKKGGVSPHAEIVLRPPTLTVSKITPTERDAKTGEVTKFKVEGTASDSDGIRDFEAFVGDSKQFLQTFAESETKTTFPFSFVLENKPKGKDRFFYIIARDVEGLQEDRIYGIPTPIEGP